MDAHFIFIISTNIYTIYTWDGLPQWLSGKESTCNAGDTGDAGLIPGSERSLEGGHSSPLQYSCLENPTDRGAWQAIVHRVAKSQAWASTSIHETLHEKIYETHVAPKIRLREAKNGNLLSKMKCSDQVASSSASGNQPGCSVRASIHDNQHPGKVLCGSWARVLQSTRSCPCAHTQARQPQNSPCFIRCYLRQMAAWTHLWIYHPPKVFQRVIEERTFVKHLTCSTKVYNCYYYHYWVQVCTAHQRQVAGTRNSYFIWKAGRLRRWWTHVPKNHLAWVRIWASFIPRGEEVKSNISWFWSASRRDVLASSFLQLFTGRPGQEVSYELNKCVLA